MLWVWIAIPVGLLLVVAALFLMREPVIPLPRLQEEFQRHRSSLETAFLQAAGASGKPRGLTWKSCEWEQEVVMARDRTTGEVHALVGVTIQFEAIPGGDMEGLPAVGNLRNASAVFFHQKGRWRTSGKAVFNLNPEEAVRHFQKQYERLPVSDRD